MSNKPDYIPQVGDKVKFVRTVFENDAYTRRLKDAGKENTYEIKGVRPFRGSNTAFDVTLDKEIFGAWYADGWIHRFDNPLLKKATQRRKI